MKSLKWILLIIVIVSPFPALAAVSISEVAWMGSSDSANHEWIELYNDGEAVDVSDWTLTDGMNLSIKLTGTIPAGSYIVLERTSDESAAGAAFSIYTGALVNTGATLRLENASGALVTQVSGGENWGNIGGDNVTKETAQYKSGSWVTAAATPGNPPPNIVATVDDQPDDVPDSVKTKSTASAKKNSSGETVRLELPGVTLSLDIGAQEIGYINQPIKFSVTPSGIGEHLIDSLQYQWNFGDGLISAEKEPTHSYEFPGTYVVTVMGEFKRQRQVARYEITILPVSVSLTKNPSGDVQVNNDSPYEIDISGYRLSGRETFEFPPYSVILPNQTVTIARNKLVSGAEALVALYDPKQLMVASLLPGRLQTSQFLAQANYEEEGIESLAPFVGLGDYEQIVSAPVISSFAFASDKPAPITETAAAPAPATEPTSMSLVEEALTSTSSLAAAIGSATESGNGRLIYVALASTMLLGVLGVYTAPKRRKDLKDAS